MEKRQSYNLPKNSLEELFGNVLRQLRNEKGISQEDLGFESGYHRTYISMLERGKKSPSLRTIFQLAKALGVEPASILYRLQDMINTSSDKKYHGSRVKK